MATIFSLPPELIALILGFAAERASLLPFTQLNSSLRDIALCAAELWTHIRIREPSCSGTDLMRIETYLERSSNQFTDITLMFPSDSVDTERAIEDTARLIGIITPYFPRIRRLGLTGGPTGPGILNFVYFKTHRLLSFTSISWSFHSTSRFQYFCDRHVTSAHSKRSYGIGQILCAS